MSQDKQGSVGLRTRRALNSLQYSPNGRDIVGLSPRKSNQQTKLPFECSNPEPFNKINKRTSISLPDFHADGSLKPPVKSITSSTPLRSKGVSSSKGSPSKLRRMKNEISIIAEEKENPNYSLHSSTLNLNKTDLNESMILLKKPAKNEPVVQKTYSEMAIQCNKLDEDIVISDVVPPVYWKILAHKRYKALKETKKENSILNSQIDETNEKNEATRERIKELETILDQFEEIKAKMLELAEDEDYDDDEDEDDDSAVEDSGYDDPAENTERKKFKL